MKHRPMTKEERAAEDPRATQQIKREIIYLLDKLDERRLQRVLWYIQRIW